MTQVLTDRATLEQLVAALEKSVGAMQGIYGGWRCEQPLKLANAAITQGRAALANAEPTVVSADEELMRGILERMERYQTKRGDYETFEEQAAALRKRLEKHQ